MLLWFTLHRRLLFNKLFWDLGNLNYTTSAATDCWSCNLSQSTHKCRTSATQSLRLWPLVSYSRHRQCITTSTCGSIHTLYAPLKPALCHTVRTYICTYICTYIYTYVHTVYERDLKVPVHVCIRPAQYMCVLGKRTVLWWKVMASSHTIRLLTSTSAALLHYPSCQWTIIAFHDSCCLPRETLWCWLSFNTHGLPLELTTSSSCCRTCIWTLIPYLRCTI